MIRRLARVAAGRQSPSTRRAWRALARAHRPLDRYDILGVIRAELPAGDAARLVDLIRHTERFLDSWAPYEPRAEEPLETSGSSAATLAELADTWPPYQRTHLVLCLRQQLAPHIEDTEVLVLIATAYAHLAGLTRRETRRHITTAAPQSD